MRDTPLAANSASAAIIIRTVPLDVANARGAPSEPVLIKNLAHDPDLPASAQIATDFLQLVRYGLRRRRRSLHASTA